LSVAASEGGFDDGGLPGGAEQVAQLGAHLGRPVPGIHGIVEEADGTGLGERRGYASGIVPRLLDPGVEPGLVAVEEPRRLADLFRRRPRSRRTHGAARPEGEEVASGLGGGVPLDQEIAVDVVLRPDLPAESEIGALQVAPAGEQDAAVGDGQLVVHPAGDPERLVEAEGVVLADRDPLGQQVGLDGARNPVPLGVDEQLDADAAAGGVAQQPEAGEGERVVANDERRGEDLLPRREHHLHPRLRRLPVGREEAHPVG
jgi:hypothetical protein